MAEDCGRHQQREEEFRREDAAEAEEPMDNDDGTGPAEGSADDEGLSFKKYTSFDPAKKEDLEHAQEAGFANERWVVTEKVHGANMCLMTDGQQVLVAKRTALVLPGAMFFRYEQVVEKYTPNVLKAFEVARALLPQLELKKLYIYGELFGGGYPHRDVPPHPRQILIQKHVYYCPWTEFYAFDLSPGKGFLDYDVCIEVFKAAGFFYAEPLAYGTLQEALAFCPTFQTTIPARLGLPPIEGNTAEGTVVKRVKCSRPIFKNKDAKFREVTEPRKGLGTAGPRVARPRAPVEPLPDILQQAQAYVNENRMDSVVSKEGQVKLEDAGRLLGLLAKDALQDFIKDQGGKEKWEASVPKELQQRLGKVLATRSRVVVAAWFQHK